MQLLTMILSLIGFFTLAHAVAISTGSDLPYAVEPFQYRGTLGGREVQLNGTVQEIYARMHELYPDFDPKPAARSDKSNLRPRDTAYKNGIFCCPVAGQPWTGAVEYWIYEGINYLNGLSTIGINGRTSRISCSWGSAIWFCNDNGYYIEPTASYLASYAQDLINTCGYFDWWTQTYEVCGQEFDSDRYNIIVRADDC